MSQSLPLPWTITHCLKHLLPTTTMTFWCCWPMCCHLTMQTQTLHLASSKFECYTILCQNMVTQQDHMENPLPWWKVSTFGFILIVMGLIRNCHCARLTHMSSPLSLTSHATILPFLAPSSLSNDFSPNLVTYAPTSTLPSKQKPLWRPCAWRSGSRRASWVGIKLRDWFLPGFIMSAGHLLSMLNLNCFKLLCTV